jgi:hypothetical protein
MGVTVTIQKAALRARTRQPAGSASSARTATDLERLVVRALSRSEPAQRICKERVRIRAQQPQRPAAVPRQRRGKGNAANSASDSDDYYIPEKVSSNPDDGPHTEAPRQSTRRGYGGASCGGGGTGAVSVPSLQGRKASRQLLHCN